MTTPYQDNFSALYPAAAGDVEGRRRKAGTIAAVFADHVGDRDRLRRLSLLDVGAGNGVIDHCLAGHFGNVPGIDIDAAAIARQPATRVAESAIRSRRRAAAAGRRRERRCSSLRARLRARAGCAAADERDPARRKGAISRAAYALVPTYIWLLEKRA